MLGTLNEDKNNVQMSNTSNPNGNPMQDYKSLQWASDIVHTVFNDHAIYLFWEVRLHR